MKPALFIDFDGTLCRDRFWQNLGAVDYGRVNDYLFRAVQPAADWMKGAYSSEDICALLAAELKIGQDVLWESLLSGCRSMRVSAGSLSKISCLRKKYAAALVTVNMDCFDRFTVPALGLHKHFDHIINSFNEKIFKHGPDRGLFDIALSRCGAVYQNSVLIDDSQNACDEFQNRGGRALKIYGSKNLNYYLDLLISEIQ